MEAGLGEVLLEPGACGWRAFGLAPHKTETWKLSKDPQFTDKVRDIVGLYLDPPERALVLCVDEKTQVQALDRTAPTLPMLPGTPSLYAALDLASGKVIGSLHARHRAVEFGKFLRKIDAEVPSRCIWCSTTPPPQDPTIKRWLAAHPRFVLHFTPTSSSWLNLVERWFAELTTKKLQRSAHRSVAALNADIRAWIQAWNDNPKPYVWTKTADDILDSIANYCRRVSDSEHETGRRALEDDTVQYRHHQASGATEHVDTWPIDMAAMGSLACAESQG